MQTLDKNTLPKNVASNTKKETIRNQPVSQFCHKHFCQRFQNDSFFTLSMSSLKTKNLSYVKDKNLVVPKGLHFETKRSICVHRKSI